MHAVKVTWSGQTFALAKGNDSQGKKSRIHRSKEERRAMVESFINKYRSSNNGNFPSLNLTHKEVGGSFYTVREIVRDIIQENRVLGPAAGFSDEHSLDYSSEQYEPDSLSRGIHSSLSLSSVIGSASASEHRQKENSAILNEFQVEPVSVPRGNSTVRYFEMVESKEVGKTDAHSNENRIPQFIHKDATDEQQNLYGSERMNGSLIDEESKEAAKESLELGKHITQENKASSESPSSEKLDD